MRTVPDRQSNEADASQVPPAIPAMDQDGPEGVSGENAEAARAAAELAALARQGAGEMANEEGVRVGAAAAAQGGGAARVPPMATPARGGNEGGSGRPPPDQRAVMMRNDEELLGMISPLGCCPRAGPGLRSSSSRPYFSIAKWRAGLPTLQHERRAVESQSAHAPAR